MMNTRKPKILLQFGSYAFYHGQRNGFALVSSLLILTLLVGLIVVLLGLMQVETRSVASQQQVAQARQNALAGLQIAIGELQTQMGPDQRISANGSILSDIDNNALSDDSPVRHWTGVWNSWYAGSDWPQDPLSQPPTAQAASEHSTIEGASNSGTSPTYEANREDYFRTWLVSLSDADRTALEGASIYSAADSFRLTGDGSPDENATSVKLLGHGTLGTGSDTADHVAARLIPLLNDSGGSGDPTGRYGWWITDQNQKGWISPDAYTVSTSLSDAEKLFRQQAPGSMGVSMISELTGLTEESELTKAGYNLNQLDLLSGVSGNPSQQITTLNSDPNPSPSFHHVTTLSKGILADVREGGLKRDLSVLLERPIDINENGDEFMLYAFDDPRFPYQNNPNDKNRANSRVPIQDLAAYYQLYDHQPVFANGRRGGVHYDSSELSNSLQINVPDLDNGNKDQEFLIREYTSLYRRPVVAKVQFLVGVTAEPVTQAERDWVEDVVNGTKTIKGGSPGSWDNNMKLMRVSDTHKLKLGIQPLVTLWNPNNLPLVMKPNQILRYNCPPVGFKIRKHRAGGGIFEARWMNLGYANNAGTGTSAGQGGGKLLSLRLAKNTVVFEPGEVKVFSIPSSTAANLTDDGGTLDLGETIMDVVNEYDPFGVFLMRNSAPVNHNNTDSPDVYPFNNEGQMAQTMVFNPDDSFSISIDTESADTATAYDDGRNASKSAEIAGAAFSLYLFDEGYIDGHYSTWADALRHDILISRHATSLDNTELEALGDFYRQLMLPGFPGGTAPIEFESESNAIPGTQLKLAGEEDEIIALMDFSLSIGCESPSSGTGGFGGGRRITSRPFLHSATSALPFITEADEASLYDYGLDWQVSRINNVEDSILQAKPGTGNGYYGGGYTVESGTTHVTQNEVPVLPPISIASLSHAYLGGFSIAKAIPVGEDPETDAYWFKNPQVKNPTGVSFQRVTASGQNGLAPRIAQAIGNSYAHPNIPAEKAFITKDLLFNVDEGSFNVPYVDHSYLVNKALWDEYFFSSMSPQPAKVELFESSSDRTAKQVANDFFFNGRPLPNRRFRPYGDNLDQAGLDSLFVDYSLFSDGLADKIASYLVVDGAFNVNSTSVEAWKLLFSSLWNKSVAFLESGNTPTDAPMSGETAVGPGMLPNAAPVDSGSISDPNTPSDQWKAWRALSDDEISELAEAMVKQVRLRGPFLSLSDFVNRQLSSDPNRAAKGALQAALDDDSVAINANFRTPGRTLDDEVSGVPFEFPEAAQGPIAYGSAAYVDQADILRGLAGQLTARGDTFVIRSYGDSLDGRGKVAARAWCEAVVQRVPEYVDPAANQPHEKQSDLSAPNDRFGRQFKIIGFRWLNASEI